MHCHSGRVATGATILLAFYVAQASAASPYDGCNSGALDAGNTLQSAGCQAEALGAYTLAVGSGASAKGLLTTAVGDSSAAQAEGATALGGATGLTDHPGYYATAIGTRAIATGSQATALGAYSRAMGTYSIAIGTGVDDAHSVPKAAGSFGIAIGTNASVTGINAVAVGAYAGSDPGAANNYSTAFGYGAGSSMKGEGNTALGLVAGLQVTGDLNTAVGNSAGQIVAGTRNISLGVSTAQNVKGSYNAAFGDQAGSAVNGSYNIAIGASAGRETNADYTTAVGKQARVTADYGIALGSAARVTAVNSVAIGRESTATTANTISVGRPRHERRIVNVGRAKASTDAVNLGQVKQMISQAKSGRSFSNSADDTSVESGGGGNANLIATGGGKTSNGRAQTGSTAPKPACSDGDIAGNWSLFATNIEAAGAGSVLWCDAQFSRAGGGQYSVVGHCRAHEPRNTAPTLYDLGSARPITVNSTCQLGGNFVLRQGDHSFTAAILEGHVDAAPDAKTRAVGVSRITAGEKVALQTFVMER